MSNKTSALVAQKPAGLSKPAKVAIWVAAILLVAALAFGIVWTSIDHSYRYDLEDLSPFFKDGAAIDYAGLDSLPITLETDVSRDEWLDQIAKNMKALDEPVLEGLYRVNADLSAVGNPYQDIAYIYYSVYQAKNVGTEAEPKWEKDGDPIMSNTAYTAKSATEVRLGSGTLHEKIEEHMKNSPQYQTTIDRITDTTKDIPAGYTRVISLTITYEKANSSGEGTTTTKYLTLDNYNLEIGEKGAPTIGENEPGSTEYYKGVSTFEGMATQVSGNSVEKELSDALIEKFTALTKVGDSFTDESLSVKLSGSNEATALKIEGKVVACFLAEQVHQTMDLKENFKYKDAAGTEQTIETGKKLILDITLEKVLKLDKETVLALTADKTDFVAPTKIGANEDHDYATEYMGYVKETMQKEAVDKMKTEANVATLTANVKNALWKEITALYATDAYIDSFPDDEIEKYCEAMIEAYEGEFASATGLKYANVTEYMLAKVFEVSDVSKMDAAEQKRVLDEKLTAKAEESIRKQILLFWLGDHYGVEITKADKKAAEKEIYNAYYSTYVSLYTSYYSTVYTASDIARLARQDAKAQVEALCTEAYLREYVTLTKVQDKLVTDAKNYANITWTFEGEAVSE